MRPLVAVAAATALLAGFTGAAAAEVALVKGGPRADRGRAESALRDAASAMNVCWRGKPPAKVRVKLAVAADGAVTATAAGKGAAQCAAGVLAVWTLPGGPWSGEVDIDAAAPPQDLAATVHTGLLARSAPVKACQAKAPAAAGKVAIKMLIHPDGTITGVEVSSSLGAAIDGCVKKEVAAIRLDELEASAPIKYQLAVVFAGDGGGGGGGADPVGPVEAPDGGSVAGPLGADQVKPTMTAARPKLLACGKKGSAKGTVVTRFTIRPDGTTKNVVIKEPLGDTAIETCLVGVFKSLSFPTGSGETKVAYPVAFR